jgi:hypothetical protein
MKDGKQNLSEQIEKQELTKSQTGKQYNIQPAWLNIKLANAVGILKLAK